MNKEESNLISNLTPTERSKFNQWFKEEYEKEVNLRTESHINTMALIATKGTLDWAYPPFILASTASALG
ncbi:MAG: DsrE/DsrF/DrsH-like family protein, partial [Sulfuriferula sp.]